MDRHIEEHPQWAHRNVTLICGPPGSGKTTLARQLHVRVIELEDYTSPDHRTNLKAFGLAAYKTGRSNHTNTAIVRGAPTPAEREHHQQLCRPARTITLLTDAATCHERVTQRARPEADREHAAIDKWWTDYTRVDDIELVPTREW